MSVRWRTKLFLLLLTFSLLPILGLFYYGARTQERMVREATLDGLDALATAKAEAINQFTEFRKRDVERIGNLMATRVETLLKAKAALGAPQTPRAPEPLPDVTAPATGTPTGPPSRSEDDAERRTAPRERPAATPQPGPAARRVAQADLDEAKTALSRALNLVLWDQEEFEELLVFDLDGIVLASTFTGHEGNTAENVEYFEKGRKGTYLQPMFVSPITNQPTMVVATPIQNSEAEEIGVLAARLNLNRFFRLIGDTTGLGKTGETVVGKKSGDQVLFMAPTRHDAQAAFQRSIPLDGGAPDPLREAARGQSSRGLSRDYRGVTTFAAWQYIPSLDWGLVVKMDEDEALEGLYTAERNLLFIALIMGLLAALASMVVSRALVKPLGHLKDATDRISRGDFAVQLDIESRDEIGELADSFERMVAAIKFFRERAARAQDDEAEEPDAIAAREEEARLRMEGGSR